MITATVAWSHLSMKAYEHFLVCDLCGAMVHDSPKARTEHERWHDQVAKAIHSFLAETDPDDAGGSPGVGDRGGPI